MRRIVLLSGLLLGACVQLSACAQTMNPSEAAAPVPGKVSDLDAFGRFIASRPTPEQFRARYPDVKLVLPGDIATKEFRHDNSRYFADTDSEGRITGGRFM